MKAIVQMVYTAALFALLLSGCRANPVSTTATTAPTAIPTVAETTMPETQPTTEMTTQPTEVTTVPTQDGTKERIATRATEYAKGKSGQTNSSTPSAAAKRK